jgi:hypothetical protein
MRQKLESLSNLAIIVFVLIVGGFYVKDRLHPPELVGRPPQPQINAGDLLPNLPGYDWHSSRRTLVLALRNGCHYCEESAPLYRKLEEMSTKGDLKDIHVVAILPDDQQVAQEMMKKEGLGLDFIPDVNFQILKISGTPTAILADQMGRVMKTWVGEVKNDREKDLLDAIR